ncbi:MAG TPA: undecaprenyl-diphosphate phosphatase [Candidatus Nanoarchaeia archaeon]|nr:undecaprenyl-diphosphate phosphatase [Candidatus Nanoarchaeia archaeon]
MSLLHALILGAVQGLTEFLPISSSGHLVLIPYFFGWQYQGVSFDVALHAGTVVALLVYFWHDWLIIIKNGFTKKSTALSQTAWPYPRNFLWLIVVASIPAAVLGLPLDKWFEHNVRSVLFIAFNLAFFGWLLWFTDKKAQANLAPAEMTYGKAFIVGLFQSIALIPGVSRSGITLTGSRLVGLGRAEAARFSFLLGTPAIIGAFLVELPKIIKDDLNLSFWLGVITAAVLGVVAIKFLLAYLKKNDFTLFLWYRVAIALVVAIVFLLRR